MYFDFFQLASCMVWKKVSNNFVLLEERILQILVTRIEQKYMIDQNSKYI